MHKVFVYGTLKRGQPNHYWGRSGSGESQYCGQGITLKPWPLVIATDYNIPFLLEQSGTGQPVHGEIYRLDDESLAAFDKMERHPTWYRRGHVDVQMLTDEDDHDITQKEVTERAWVYFMPDFRQELLALSFFANYDSFGAHGKRYVGPTQRNDHYSIDMFSQVKEEGKSSHTMVP